ncbi:Nucleolar complex protein 2-like protein [Zea mays]|nr:Nucleolar complex protein 2-like protein [Zea mays]ONM19238.1 Nucleolar complex protein 2-like protein [Zea mays]
MGNFLFCLMGDMSYTLHHHDSCWKAPLHCSEMTDEQMIAFIVHRVRASAVFLTAFPSLLRKYVKALFHTWARGLGAMPLVSFMFLRDLCIQVGSNCLDTCLKGIYKAYLVNCKLSKSISGSKQQHIQFLGNCVRELYSLDPQSAYQHAFIFIHQLGVILRGALTERGPKKSYQKIMIGNTYSALSFGPVLCADIVPRKNSDL